MRDRNDSDVASGYIAEALFEHMTYRDTIGGLYDWEFDWDPAASDGDPDAAWIATAPDGTRYEVDVEVTLRPVKPVETAATS